MHADGSTCKDLKGFTLVEVVIVIVILAIVGTASVAYVRFSAQGYIDLVKRQAIGQKIYIAFEKTNRLVREALPSSIRTFADATRKCIEWIPIEASGYYFTDIANAITSLEVIEDQVQTYPSLQLSIFPQVEDANVLYQQSQTSYITQNSITVNDPTPGDQLVDLQIAPAHTFPESSPQNRFFLINTPLMLCFNSTHLLLYRAYGFQSTIAAAIAVLGTSVPNRQVLIDEIDFGASSFSYIQDFEQSNAIVDVQLGFNLSTGTQTLNQQVHIRNVP